MSEQQCVCGHVGRESHVRGKKGRTCLHCPCGRFTPNAPNPDPIDWDSPFRQHLRKREWYRRLRANMYGYFWLPCEICGTFSGGHEWGDIDGKISTIPTAKRNTDRGICPACTTEGRGWSNNGWVVITEEGLT